MSINDNPQIFRSFTFYNYRTNTFDFTSSKSTENKTILRTFGYFDEMITESINIDDKAKNGNFEVLWKHINTMNSKLISTQNDYSDKSFQNIFGVPISKNNNPLETTDEEFWNKDNNEYAYTFIVLVQFFDSNEKNLLEKIVAYKENLIRHIEKNKLNYKKYFKISKKRKLNIMNDSLADMDFIISDYVTFDRYDYILCLKSNCYHPIVLAIQQLYSLKCNEEYLSLNSFTVTAINPIATKLLCELIPSVCIKCNYDENAIYLYNCNEKSSDKFNVFSYLKDFKMYLSKQLYPDGRTEDNRLYFISGEYDLRFIARNVSAENLMSLFTKKSELHSDYLYGFSTIINVLCLDDISNGIFQKIDCTYNKSTDISIDKIVNCNKIINNLSDKYPESLVKTLFQINSGLSALRPMNNQSRSYNFISIYSQFYSFVKLLSEKDNSSNEIQTFSIFNLLHSFGSVLSSSIRSDFREFHIPTFNATLYYAPTKLLVLYRFFVNSFLHYYKDLYKNSKEHFVVNIGNSNITNIKEMIHIKDKINNSDDRFFVCQMSENNLYNIKDSLILLTHELAHHGMKVARNREERFKLIKDSYILLYIFYFKISLYNELAQVSLPVSISAYRTDFFTEYLVKESFTNEIKSIIEEELCRNSNGNILSITNDYHFDETFCSLNMLLKKSITKIKERIRAKIFSDNKTKFINIQDKPNIHYNISYVKELVATFDKTLNSSISFLAYSNNVNYSDSISYFLCYFFKETFADIVAIINLELSCSEYLDSLMDVFNTTGISKDSEKFSSQLFLKYRFYIVYDAINQINQTHNDFFPKWNNDELSDHRNNKNSHRLKTAIYDYNNFRNKELHFVMSYVNDDGNFIYESSCTIETMIKKRNYYSKNSVFYDQMIFENFVDYIKKCIQILLRDKCEMEYPPKEIYRSLTTTNTSIEEKSYYIDELLSYYEKKIAEK